MNELMMASYGLLWLIVLVLIALVAALTRQIGLLHTRIAPVGALMTNSGPKLGELAPALVLESLTGGSVSVGGQRDHAQLILFVSPTCPVCKSLVPAAISLAGHERKRLDLVFASDGGDPEGHRQYLSNMHIDQHPYVVSMDLGMRFEVGKLPYAVLIDSEGVLRSKGLVNSREHLESLVEAMDSGYDSIQDYLKEAELLGERA